MDGLGIVPVAMGMFGIGEVLENIASQMGVREIYKTKIKGVLPNLKDWKDSFWPIIRGTIIGFFVGILPGPSVVISTFTSYAVEKKISRHPEKFGTGVIEGVAGPESANNAGNPRQCYHGSLYGGPHDSWDSARSIIHTSKPGTILGVHC
jgi:putative tricarboxylic transport membrane protein